MTSLVFVAPLEAVTIMTGLAFAERIGSHALTRALMSVHDLSAIFIPTWRAVLPVWIGRGFAVWVGMILLNRHGSRKLMRWASKREGRRQDREQDEEKARHLGSRAKFGVALIGLVGRPTRADAHKRMGRMGLNSPTVRVSRAV